MNAKSKGLQLEVLVEVGRYCYLWHYFLKAYSSSRTTILLLAAILTILLTKMIVSFTMILTCFLDWSVETCLEQAFGGGLHDLSHHQCYHD